MKGSCVGFFLSIILNVRRVCYTPSSPFTDAQKLEGHYLLDWRSAPTLQPLEEKKVCRWQCFGVSVAKKKINFFSCSNTVIISNPRVLSKLFHSIIAHFRTKTKTCYISHLKNWHTFWAQVIFWVLVMLNQVRIYSYIPIVKYTKCFSII